MMKKIFRHLLYYYLFPYAGLFLVRLLSATYRIKIVDLDHEQNILKAGGQLVYASWHQRFFPGITFFSTRKPIAIMISQSRDGEMAARAVHIMGWRAVRGSSSRGGGQALETIKKLIEQGYKIGHIVDGPQGPFGRVKPGLIRIAQSADLPIVPTITSGQNRWVFNSWDRFMVPKPFSRVIIRFGSPIYMHRDMLPGEFEQMQAHVAQVLKQLYEDTDAVWQDGTRMKEIFGFSFRC
ncbi:lysophospholipid acyltransferase family protein [uncultured Desulfobacter sp.]|uniref:lysophospholipid acyltransferase family protein n=1 Tax=uncultured Desulfobacter sp. TaxID=240139 RepID=UPI0029F58A07|nr:lysophospholipid acyltransferase family protein [uncultured Desulfobacter sp.]